MVLIPNIGFDTAENEPCEVCLPSVYRSPRCPHVLEIASNRVGVFHIGEKIYAEDTKVEKTESARILRTKEEGLLIGSFRSVKK